MSIPPDYFPGRASYRRLHAMATVLERFCARAPDALTLAQLGGDVELPKRTLKSLCFNLERLGLLMAVGTAEQWTLADHPGKLTLDDVWRAAQFPIRSGKTDSRPEAADDIDMLISQALLAINQSISTQLRKFQLDSVRIAQRGLWSIR